jgi:Zn finger protein HypA/HybF involved in hydrogenase expression
MGYAAGEMLKRTALQLGQEREFEHEVTVEFRCKSCGKKFKKRLYSKWKSDEGTEEEKELELNVQCPKCKSSEVEILVQSSKF